MHLAEFYSFHPEMFTVNSRWIKLFKSFSFCLSISTREAAFDVKDSAILSQKGAWHFTKIHTQFKANLEMLCILKVSLYRHVSGIATNKMYEPRSVSEAVSNFFIRAKSVSFCLSANVILVQSLKRMSLIMTHCLINTKIHCRWRRVGRIRQRAKGVTIERN